MPLIVAFAVVFPLCIGLAAPADGPIVDGFAPIGRYAGHWGIDYAAQPGSAVRAADSGLVSFVGVVVGNRSVTIDHGGLRTSYSYLTATLVRSGTWVRRGEVIGRSGVHQGRPSLHFSTRIGGRYVDPVPLLRCAVAPAPGLWLRSAAYPPTDARHHGRNVRPTTHGTPRRR